MNSNKKQEPEATNLPEKALLKMLKETILEHLATAIQLGISPDDFAHELAKAALKITSSRLPSKFS